MKVINVIMLGITMINVKCINNNTKTNILWERIKSHAITAKNAQLI